jgi:sulfite reductase alpha subunit-like flavoprotein
MAEFADRMKSFTDHLRTSIKMRNESLAQVQSSTEDLRNRARAFMEQTSDEHRERAEELHATLAAHREECRERAAELREKHQESLRKTRTDLQRMLSAARKARQDTANELRHSFQHARNELALDLHEAAAAWQAFAAGHDAPVAPKVPTRAEPSEPKSNHHPKGAKPASHAKQDEPVHSSVSAPAKRSDHKPTKGVKVRAQAHPGS